jgi:predicted nucleic acid-binding protein
VPESISDTGPILHLQEIDRLPALLSVPPLTLPDLVAAELKARGLGGAVLQKAGIAFRVMPVEAGEWQKAIETARPHRIQPADAQVFVLARLHGFQSLVLTDDLTLRRRLEAHGNEVAGTFGLLVRAYAAGDMARGELDSAVEALIETSSLHLSRPFRAYLHRLLESLP